MDVIPVCGMPGLLSLWVRGRRRQEDLPPISLVVVIGGKTPRQIETRAAIATALAAVFAAIATGGLPLPLPTVATAVAGGLLAWRSQLWGFRSCVT